MHQPEAGTQCHSSGNLSEMGHYGLKAASSRFFSIIVRRSRQTQEDGAHFFASGERDEDSPLEKARPADLIVNHGRQNTRVGKPLSLPSPSPRALIISARRGKRSHKTRSEMARRGPRYVSPSRHEPNSLRDHSLRRRVTIFMRL